MSQRRCGPRSLHWKLTLASGAVLVGVATTLILGGVHTVERYGRELRQFVNRDVARHIAAELSPFDAERVDERVLKAVFMDVMHVNPTLEVYLLDGEGGILAFDAPPGSVKAERVDLEPVLRFLDAPDRVLVQGPDPRRPGADKPFTAWPLQRDGLTLGYVYVVLGGDEYESVAALLRGSAILRVSLASGLLVLLAGAAFGFGVFAWLTRPLRRLHAGMARVGQDELPEPVDIESEDEIGELARTYDDMAHRIREQWGRLEGIDHRRRRFLAGISHDLRTPLSALRGYLELLEESGVELAPERHEQYVRAAQRGARQLTRLVDQVFELARLEAGDRQLDLEEFDLAELVQDVLQQYAVPASRRSQHLACRLPRRLPSVLADLGLVERALGNLLSNALKFTPRGGTVTVRLGLRGRRVEVQVSDTGPGIPASELEHVFERSWRSDRPSGPQRGRAGGLAGAGLGLSITRRILEMHESEITVQSELGSGTTFRFGLQATHTLRVLEKSCGRDRSVRKSIGVEV